MTDQTGEAGDAVSRSDFADEQAAGSNNLEVKNLELERYKAHLKYKKVIIISGYVAVVIALIPPSFQLATAFLEYVRTTNQLKVDEENRVRDREVKQDEFRDSYVKEFLDRALSQDIELRLRLAEYFKFVSSSGQAWEKYYNELFEKRTAIRTCRNSVNQRAIESKNRGSYSASTGLTTKCGTSYQTGGLLRTHGLPIRAHIQPAQIFVFLWRQYRMIEKK
jgi:hypothetical protein